MIFSEAKPILEALVLVAAAVGGVAAIWRLVWLPIIKASLRVKAFFKRLCDSLDKINVIDSRVMELEKQTRTNGGTSLKDDLNLIKERLISIENLVSVQMEEDEHGVFICDSLGNNSYLNRTYCHLLGVTKEELTGQSWRSFVPHNVAESYEALWKEAFSSNREISTDLPLQRADGKILCSHISAFPLSRSTDKSRRFLGKIKINSKCSGERCFIGETCPHKTTPLVTQRSN